MGTLIKENTVIGEEVSAVLVELYQEFSSGGVEEAKGEEKIKGVKLEWSAIALRKTFEGSNPNKMYMKVHVEHNPRGKVVGRTVNMTLVEYRLFAEDLSRAENLLS